MDLTTVESLHSFYRNAAQFGDSASYEVSQERDGIKTTVTLVICSGAPMLTITKVDYVQRVEEVLFETSDFDAIVRILVGNRGLMI